MVKGIIPTARASLFMRWHGLVKSSPVGHRLASGAFWSLIGAVMSRGLGTLSMVVVARILGKEQFGRLGIIQSTVDMFQTFAGFGLGLMATRYVAQFRSTDPVRAGRILSLSGLMACGTGLVSGTVLVMLAPHLAHHALADPELTGPLRVSAITLFFAAMNGTQTGALAGFEAFRAIAKVGAVMGVLTFTLMVGGVRLYGMEGVVWAMATCGFQNCVINRFLLHKEMRRFGVRLSFSAMKSELPLLWGFSLPNTLGDLMVMPANWVSRSMVATQPHGYGELGLFSAASQFTVIVGQLVNVLGAPLVPLLAGQDRDCPSKRLSSGNMIFYWCLGLVFVLPLLAFPEVFALVYGAEFSGVAMTNTAVLVMLYTLVRTYKNGLANALIADGRMWWGFASNTLWAVALVTSLVFLLQYGAVGLAASMLIAYSLNVCVFVPVYFSTGLVPKGSILSKHAGWIWGLVGLTASAAVAGVPPMWRAVVLLVAGVFIGLNLLRIWQKALISDRDANSARVAYQREPDISSM